MLLRERPFTKLDSRFCELINALTTHPFYSKEERGQELNWRSDKLHSPKKYQVSDELEAESGSRVDSDMTSQQENGERRVRSIRTEEVGSEFYMPTNEVNYIQFSFLKT